MTFALAGDGGLTGMTAHMLFRLGSRMGPGSDPFSAELGRHMPQVQVASSVGRHARRQRACETRRQALDMPSVLRPSHSCAACCCCCCFWLT